jgi:hypothetical protein
MDKRRIPLRRIMFQKPSVRIVRGTDVKPAGDIFMDINPEKAVRCVQTRQVGLEPTTSRLTAGCSTIELLPNSAWCSIGKVRGVKRLTFGPWGFSTKGQIAQSSALIVREGQNAAYWT